MWSDGETSVDLLGFAVHKDLIKKLVTDDSLLPVTVGIFGDWGGGKSSVMRMLQQDLEQDETVACLYFNGWMFEGYDDAKAALISAILVQLGEHQRVGPKIRSHVVPLLKRVNYLRGISMLLRRGAMPMTSMATSAGVMTGAIDPHTALMLNAAAAGLAGAPETQAPPGDEAKASDPSSSSGLVEAAQDLGQVDWQRLLNDDHSAPSLLDVRSFRDDFERLIAETNLRSVIVLIDDLDRCEPGRLIENLEAIKLFLAVKKTAFVIAADARIVRYAIGSRYAAPQIRDQQTAEDEPYDLVTDYLEKLIQIPYHLPRLSPSEIESYITLLFCRLHLQDNEFNHVRLHCEEARRANPYLTYGVGAVREALGDHLEDILDARLHWSRTIAPALTEGLKGNPRQVKRFLNALLLRKQLADVAQLGIRDDILVKLMLLEYSRGQLFDQLYRWQAAANGHPPQLHALEAEANPGRVAPGEDTESSPDTIALDDALPGWQEKAAQAWLQLEPPLAGVDLRDYFWIARDRLRTTLSGLPMLSPAVRLLFDRLVSGNEGERTLAAREATNLDSDELASLIQTLGQHLERHPGDPDAGESLLALIEQGINEALAMLLATLKVIPATKVEPGIVFALQSLHESSPLAKVEIVALVQRWAATQTPAGAAAKSALRDLGYATHDRQS